jgi:hypothetical protein
MLSNRTVPGFWSEQKARPGQFSTIVGGEGNPTTGVSSTIGGRRLQPRLERVRRCQRRREQHRQRGGEGSVSRGSKNTASGELSSIFGGTEMEAAGQGKALLECIWSTKSAGEQC